MNHSSDPLLSTIVELRTLFPEFRFGQLVSNLVISAGYLEMEGIYDATDEELRVAAQRMIDQNSGRRGIIPAVANDDADQNLPKEHIYDELADAVADLRGLVPSRRLASLTTHLVALAGYPQVESIYDILDEELLNGALRMSDDYRRRLTRKFVTSAS